MKDNKMNKKRIIVGIVAFLLALLMVLPMIITVVTSLPTASAVTQGEIDELIAQSNDMKQQREALAKELANIKGDKEKAVQAKQLLDGEMALLESEIATIERTIETFDALIVQKEVELVEAQEAERAQFELFCRRVRAMEESGSSSYLSVVFGAKGVSDLLDKITIINDVVAYDNAVANTLEEMRREIEDAKAALQEFRDEQQLQKDDLDTQKDALNVKVEEAAALVREIQAQESEYQSAIDKYKAAENAASAEIDRLQKELIKQNIQYNAGDGYLWPLDGYYRLSSLFGPRKLEITGSSTNHGGTDIPAPKNTPVRATKGGVVILTGLNNYYYGKFVSIGHSDTESSLYAHLNSLNVTDGQVVEQGDIIGYVGTTGISTGYHLHFEIRQNNVKTNAVMYFEYLKGVIYYSYGGYTSYDWDYLTKNKTQ